MSPSSLPDRRLISKSESINQAPPRTPCFFSSSSRRRSECQIHFSPAALAADLAAVQRRHVADLREQRREARVDASHDCIELVGHRRGNHLGNAGSHEVETRGQARDFALERTAAQHLLGYRRGEAAEHQLQASPAWRRAALDRPDRPLHGGGDVGRERDQILEALQPLT